MVSSSVISSRYFTAAKIENCPLSDIHELLSIEQQCHQFPWRQDNFVSCFSSNYIIRKVLVKRKMVGFYILHTLSKIQEATLMNICVHPDLQGKGIGGLLMKDFYSILDKKQINTIFLEVRESNVNAIGLYEKYGFITTGLRKNYYPAKNGREDAVLMMQELT